MKPSNFLKAAAFGLMSVAPMAASAQTWTTWDSNTSTTFDGTLFGAAVSFIGAYAGGSQFSTASSDYFAPNDPYTQGGLIAPDAGGNFGFVQMVAPTSATIKFSTPMTDVFLAFISVGSPFVGVTYSFNHAFTVLSNDNCVTPAHFGCGFYSVAGNSITGHEFSGTIEFVGTFDELTLTTDPSENWHGITVGATAAAPTLGTPEPATVALFATGLFGLAGMNRVRRKHRA